MGLLGDLGSLLGEVLANMDFSHEHCGNCKWIHTKKKWNGKGFDRVWMCWKTKKEINFEGLCQYYERYKNR